MPSFDIRHLIFMIRYSLFNTNMNTSICNTRPNNFDWVLQSTDVLSVQCRFKVEANFKYMWIAFVPWMGTDGWEQEHGSFL